MNKLHTGTCSWKYDSWKGIIYPEFGEINYLEEYSKHYNSVEVDQWFWSLFDIVKLPDIKTVEEYKKSVPGDFKFTVKIPNSITLTHYYSRKRGEPLRKNPHFMSVELFEEFLQIMKPVRNQIGSLIFQFEYLNKQKISSLSGFQRHLHQFFTSLPADVPPMSIEIRNPNYLNTSYFRFLKDLDLTNVFLQGYFMPPVIGIYNKYKDYINGQTIIRLHGPDRSGIEKISGENWNKIYINRDDELKDIIEMIKDLQNKDVDVYLNVNNHYEGCAPMTIEKIQKLL
ncbi:MAG: DUF72 domain-containing protein [Ignavibacteriaceae bacterium]